MYLFATITERHYSSEIKLNNLFY